MVVLANQVEVDQGRPLLQKDNQVLYLKRMVNKMWLLEQLKEHGLTANCLLPYSKNKHSKIRQMEHMEKVHHRDKFRPKMLETLQDKPLVCHLNL